MSSEKEKGQKKKGKEKYIAPSESTTLVTDFIRRGREGMGSIKKN